MQLIALGTGSAFTMQGWQTNLLIKHNGKNLLIDCGTDIRHSLSAKKLNYLGIDAVYISHAHADHVGGLEYIAFCSYFDSRYIGRPKLFGERELLHDLWNHTLLGGLEGLEGKDATLDTYFDVRPVARNSYFEWQDIKFDIVQSIHISAKYKLVDSFGVMFTVEGKRIYLTTDVQFAPETSLKAYYKEADFIVHDCETMYHSGVHAHYDQLRTLPPEIKSKMLLIHYQDNIVDTDECIYTGKIKDEWVERAKNDGFLGFAKPEILLEL